MQQAIQIIDAEIQQYEEWRLLHRAKGRTIEACAAALCQAAFRRLRNKIAQLEDS